MPAQQASHQNLPIERTVFTTERLVLRAPRDADAEALVSLLNDIEMVRYTEFLPFPYTLADAHDFITAQKEPDANGIQNALFACIGHEDGEIIGCTGYRGSKPPNMEIGYWVGHDHWGKGYAGEMAAAALDHAFNTLGARQVTADAVSANAASQRVLKRLGFIDRGQTTCATRMLGDQPARHHVHTAASWHAARQVITLGDGS